MRACRDIHPARDVSWIVHGNLYLATREIFKLAKEGLLEELSEEEAEGGIFNDMHVDFEQHITYL